MATFVTKLAHKPGTDIEVFGEHFEFGKEGVGTLTTKRQDVIKRLRAIPEGFAELALTVAPPPGGPVAGPPVIEPSSGAGDVSPQITTDWNFSPEPAEPAPPPGGPVAGPPVEQPAASPAVTSPLASQPIFSAQPAQVAHPETGPVAGPPVEQPSAFLLANASGEKLDLGKLNDAELRAFAAANGVKVHRRAKGNTLRKTIVQGLANPAA